MPLETLTRLGKIILSPFFEMAALHREHRTMLQELELDMQESQRRREQYEKERVTREIESLASSGRTFLCVFGGDLVIRQASIMLSTHTDMSQKIGHINPTRHYLEDNAEKIHKAALDICRHSPHLAIKDLLLIYKLLDCDSQGQESFIDLFTPTLKDILRMAPDDSESELLAAIHAAVPTIPIENLGSKHKTSGATDVEFRMV